ncbi:uncharacterized protein LOC114542636 [Dendronephthya gigantea]|uniref:uncharacterized protein LOC114542636 n=1 Tax=Dendronephthya gigantea TaxID=151771 RepID=UPI00106CEFD9|nr:uncharacterized protein LOC114542636 [Dendronephthya gigantea]
MSQESKSPQNPKGVQFFHHFPKNFLKPYGLAEENIPERDIFKRTGPLNCEWLTRPKVGLSEFADTIGKNFSFLTESDSQFIRKSKFAPIEEKMRTFLSLLEKFNVLKTTENPSGEDIKDFLKFMLQEDDQIDQFFTEMFQLGGAMYLLGSHYTVIKTLLSNPDWTAEKNVGTSAEVRNFKANPTIKGLKTYLTNSCSSRTKHPTSEAVKGTKRNLAKLFDSDDEDNDIAAREPSNVSGQSTPTTKQHTPTKDKRKKRKQK